MSFQQPASFPVGGVPRTVPPPVSTDIDAALVPTLPPDHQLEATEEEPAQAVPAPSKPAVKAKRHWRRLPPPGLPVPHQGFWHVLRYQLWLLHLGSPNKLPKISRKQQAEIDHQNAQLEEDARQRQAELEAEAARVQAEQYRNDVTAKSIARIKELNEQVPTATFVSANSKGAGATTTTLVWTASEAGEITHAVVNVFDGNPASGTSAARLGKDIGETITVQQLHEAKADLSQNLKTFLSRARPSAFNVRCISANSIIKRGGNNRLTPEEYADILRISQANCEYMFVDSPNDITEPVSLEVFNVGDVFIFTANVGVQDSLRQLGTSMETLRNYGFEDQVNHSVVVISNVPSGVDVNVYKKYLNHVNMKDEVIERYEEKFEGPFLAVPHDPEIAKDSVVDLWALQWETSQAYREVFIAALEQAAKNKARLEASAHQQVSA